MFELESCGARGSDLKPSSPARGRLPPSQPPSLPPYLPPLFWFTYDSMDIFLVLFGSQEIARWHTTALSHRSPCVMVLRYTPYVVFALFDQGAFCWPVLGPRTIAFREMSQCEDTHRLRACARGFGRGLGRTGRSAF